MKGFLTDIYSQLYKDPHSAYSMTRQTWEHKSLYLSSEGILIDCMVFYTQPLQSVSWHCVISVNVTLYHQWECYWHFLKLFSRSVVRVLFYQLCITPLLTLRPLSVPRRWVLYTYWIITGAVQFHDVGVIHSGELAELCTNQRYMLPSVYSFIHIHSLSQCLFHIGACIHTT